MSKFGYIQIEFEDEFKKSLAEWSKKSIESKYLIYGDIDGERIGGIVSQDAHITLIYGIPKDLDNTETIRQEIQNITLPKINISEVKCFHLEQYHAKILYLSINDENKILEQLHEKFKKFITNESPHQPPFIPHIAIAYVSENFNEQSMLYNGPTEIDFMKLKYHKE